jgi:hypothetical protein
MLNVINPFKNNYFFDFLNIWGDFFDSSNRHMKIQRDFP